MSEKQPELMEAGVLVPVYRAEDGALMLVLVRRVEGGLHGGQLALPGGKRIPSDASMADTALRESREEIGLDAASVEIVEALPAMETLTTGFRIFPFLARIVRPAQWRRDSLEIAEILEVPVEEFARPEARGEEMRSFGGRPEPKLTRFFRVKNYKLWGATYRILEPLIPRLLRREWPL
ncbi:MAG: CoA pyrophosphatase [Candidatus Eisenbacteria bacterium]|nr:CoA pyrophosphatase [Candidatus Eisenbacteria bacterium]